VATRPPLTRGNVPPLPRRRLLLARSGLFEELEPTLLAAMQEEGLELLSRREGSQANATARPGWSNLSPAGKCCTDGLVPMIGARAWLAIAT